MNAEKTKTAYAYEKFKSLLREGRVESGRIISTSELAGMIGVGRAPVLEALKRLESERHVLIIPQKGVMVREMTVQEMREINDTRIALEGFIARTVAGTFSTEDARNIQALLDEQAEAMKEENPRRFIDADAAFHMYLCEKSGNSLIIDIVQRLRERFFTAGLYILMRPERIKSTLEEHQAILEALEAQDAEKANSEMVRHIENGKRHIV